MLAINESRFLHLAKRICSGRGQLIVVSQLCFWSAQGLFYVPQEDFDCRKLVHDAMVVLEALCKTVLSGLWAVEGEGNISIRDLTARYWGSAFSDRYGGALGSSNAGTLADWLRPCTRLFLGSVAVNMERVYLGKQIFLTSTSMRTHSRRVTWAQGNV